MTWNKSFVLFLISLVKTAIQNNEWDDYLRHKAFFEEMRRQIEVRNLESQNTYLSRILIHQKMLMHIRNTNINQANPYLYQGINPKYENFCVLRNTNQKKERKRVSLIDNGMTKQILYNDEGSTEHDVEYLDWEIPLKVDRNKENNFENSTETGFKTFNSWETEQICKECKRRIALDDQKKQEVYNSVTDLYWGSMDTDYGNYGAILMQFDPLKSEKSLPEKESIDNISLASFTPQNESKDKLFLNKNILGLKNLTHNQPQQPECQKTGIGLDLPFGISNNPLSSTTLKNNEEPKTSPLDPGINSNSNETKESYVFEEESKKLCENNTEDGFSCPKPLVEFNSQSTEIFKEVKDLIDFRENSPILNSILTSDIHLQNKVCEEEPQKQPLPVIVEYHYLENKEFPSSISCAKLCCQENSRKYARKCLKVDLTEVFVKEKNNTDFCYLEPNDFRKSVITYFSKKSTSDTTAEIISDTIFSQVKNRSLINVITVAVLLRFFLKDFEKVGNFSIDNFTTVNFFTTERKNYVKPNIKLSIIVSLAWWNKQKYELSSFSKTLLIIFDAVLRNFLTSASLKHVDPSWFLSNFINKIIEGMRYFVCQASDRGVTGLRVIN